MLSCVYVSDTIAVSLSLSRSLLYSVIPDSVIFLLLNECIVFSKRISSSNDEFIGKEKKHTHTHEILISQ